MQRINFLPWRDAKHQSKNIKFVVIFVCWVLLVQIPCVIYWQYLRVRAESWKNVASHSQQFNQQRAALKKSIAEKSKQLSAFIPIYENILLRQKQRNLIIQLLPFLSKGKIKNLAITEVGWHAQVVSTEWLSIEKAKKQLQSLNSIFNMKESKVEYKNNVWKFDVGGSFGNE